MLTRLRRAYDALLHADSNGDASSAQADPDNRWKNWNAQRNTIRAAFEAALPRDDLWTLADFRDADASLRPDIRRRIRSRTRYEMANNPLVARIVKVWANDLVAGEGPWPKVSTGQTQVDRFLETAWLRWWKVSNQAGRLRRSVVTDAVDGESVSVLIANPALLELQAPDAGVMLDTLEIESDRLADPNFVDGNSQYYVDGVHLDPLTRKPIRYDLLRAHPGTEYLDALSDIFEHDTYDARQVLHAFWANRPEQHRGVSRYVCVMGISGYHRGYLEADLSRQRLRAAFAFMLKSVAPPDDEAEGDTSRWWQSVNLPNRQGVGCILPDGYEPFQFNASGESAELEQFHRIVAGLVAGCFTMPLGRALGVYSGSGYAAVRGEMGPYHHELCSDRHCIWEPMYLLPLWRAFVREIRHTPGFRELTAELAHPGRLDLLNVGWTWPEQELVVDPSREEEAKRKKLARGAICREDEIDSADLDEHDRRCARALGLGDDQQGVQAFRRLCAASIHGVQSPGTITPRISLRRRQRNPDPKTQIANHKIQNSNLATPHLSHRSLSPDPCPPIPVPRNEPYSL